MGHPHGGLKHLPAFAPQREPRGPRMTASYVLVVVNFIQTSVRRPAHTVQIEPPAQTGQTDLTSNRHIAR